jgi:uncharacterized surface protein with fasciclin (FAS1) repeats
MSYMKLHINKWRKIVTVVTAAVIILSSCNKDLPVAEPIVTTSPSGSSILETIRANGATYSYLDSAIARASGFSNPAGKLDALLNDKSAVLTFFAPDNAAFQLSFQLLGLPTAVSTLKGFSPGRLDSILRYHLIGGQKFDATSIPATFPNNIYLQSQLILQAPSATLPPGYRMPIFPGKQGLSNFANNIPLGQTGTEVANGIIHRASLILLPPSQVLWQRIAVDPDLTYFKAAVERADDGNAAKPLQSALSNAAANLTVLAPTNLAFQQLLTGQITSALIGMGLDSATAAAQATGLASTPDVFKNPALASVLTPTTVTGIVVYHLLAQQTTSTTSPFQGIRVFSVNIPSTETSSFTLLNSANAAYPGVTLKATYGFAGVIAIAVKGAANLTASNVLINPTPAPGGTSDQHYINGVLHKIDQVLRPQ